MLLDALLGEPRWLWSRLPHPAVVMGRAIGWMDATFNHGRHRKQKGAAAVFCIVVAAGAVGLVLQAVPGTVVDVLVLAVLLAQRSLCDHLRDVGTGLRQSLPAGRLAVAKIVGRDTAQMTQDAVARSAIESGAENLSDGVIAPLFWFAIGGLPGLLIYKATNTADSMIGYITPRHVDFGWAAAKLDDVLNWVPARLTAAAMLLVTWRWDLAGAVINEAPAHRSPNAGWPEAALAHALHFALSGPRYYDGTLRDYAFVNPRGLRELTAVHIDEAVVLLWKTWGVFLAVALVIALT